MKTSRGFDQKISFAWLIVFMFLASKGLFFAAATLGGLPWIIHRTFERRRSR